MTTPLSKPLVPESHHSVRSIGVLHRDTVSILVHEHVLEEILEYSERDLSRELGGFLLGGVRDDGPQQVEVRNFVPARHTESRAASLTFTHQTWSALHREIEQRFPAEAVVGWQHTHPNLGVFFSAYDVFLHRNFFGEPWQIAMVVDPQRQEFGFFQWRQNEVVDCGIWIVSQESRAAGLPSEAKHPG